MPANRSHPRSWAGFAAACLSLMAILGVLFGRSFLPHQVLFANDAPLGILMAEQGKGLDDFFGVWSDANWIGTQAPSAIPNFTNLWFVVTQAIGYAKTYAPVSLLLLGLAAWLFFAQLRFHPFACVLAGIAAALNMNTFSNACWGLPSRALTLGCAFLALAALANLTRGRLWVRAALAGTAIGLGVTEGYDVGAIFSVYLAVFALFLYLSRSSSQRKREMLAGLAAVICMALFAAWIAAQALTTLISTQVQGVAELQSQSSEERWNWATQWSLPKVEILRVIIPGLFGYRMTDADDALYEGSYWGAVGRDPLWPSRGLARHSGSGEYAGILVVLVAGWCLVEAARKKESLFSASERKVIWFWAFAALISLLFAFGRHAPFYWIVYQLPFFSAIRNPIKFMHPFHLCLLVLFGYGLETICRRYLSAAAAPALDFKSHFIRWWAAAKPFETRWVAFSIVAVAGSLVGWMSFVGAANRLESRLQSGGFPAELCAQVARFSFGEVAWYVLFLTVSLATVIAVMSGWFAGSRAKWSAALFGVILFADLARADRLWIVYYDYTETYASNPVLDLFRNQPFEHRVTGRLFPTGGGYLAGGQAQQLLPGVYEHWLRYQFPFYRIQSLDITQMPRSQERDQAFLKRFFPNGQDAAPVGRLWQLTSTRYIVGQRPFLEQINAQLDPGKNRFGAALNFNVGAKQNASSRLRIEDLVIDLGTNGQFSVFEFKGALPRAKLFTRWQAPANDEQALDTLANPSFDPLETVLISEPIPAAASSARPAGGESSVAIESYAAKKIVAQASAAAPSILLLTDKFDPNWKVTIDGQPAPLLRCNFLMRGVAVAPGKHTVVFEFQPPSASFYISLAAVFVGLALITFLALAPAKESAVGASSA